MDSFKLVNADPSPEKVDADTLVIEQEVTVRIPVNEPPDWGKKTDNIDDNIVPLLYTSNNLYITETSNIYITDLSPHSWSI